MMIFLKSLLFAVLSSLLFSSVFLLSGLWLLKTEAGQKILLRFVPPSPAIFRLASVDMVRIKNTAKAFIDFRQMTEEQHQKSYQEISAFELKLRQEYELIKNQEEQLSEPTQAFLDKKNEFQKKVAELDQLVSKRKKELESQFSKMANTIEDHIKKIINELALDRKLDLVLNTNVLDATVILYGHDAFDMTDEVIKRLDERLPNLKSIKEN
ncbi:MAG: OmpH family outer membrane protein [Proteobacteria bacterium]|nr:OmpH family outer membrane protein [Pseudomonadota bacterium]